MTLRWGIVSAGKICHDFVNGFNSYPDVGDQVIAAVAARDKSRAAEFAKLHNIPKVFGSYQELAQSKDIDIAYIGVLNPDHYNITKLFLENGKHVLCEKPLCLNLKQAQSLINIAKQKKLFLMEAVWSRFSPVYLRLEEEIKAGKIGEVKHVDVNFGVPIVAVDRLRKKELGGSAILDIGIYTLQFAQFIFKDEPKKVTAVGNLNELEVDIIDTVVLEYEGGRRAVINIDSTVKLWNKATVVGTKGRMTIEDPFHFPEVLIHVDGTVEKIPLHTSNITFFFENSAGLVFQTLEVVAITFAGLLESPRMPHKESLLLAKLEDTVRKQVGVHYDVDDEEYP
ncbi:trans-1,2-dihydrobenzene-1,2-diol dehydrogenase-like [Ostrinia furnacalis]|uniref:trans-1,2-dihydrobenzene-1,2-diol dehydrogenase-like n=1 Tax=Ostrinia furnacalis TaxID=93504 RepID=UPI001039C279|nr:trans-1,2-dihydrobenzene-1,2-diol dehydrogenase-like [Ostrinia furnacalis]